jgi:tRNA nucleotidyltransferase (CCA-adding enzyme)
MNPRVEYILKEVNKVVSPVYLVGGCVRDLYLEIEPKDFDFTTPLTPDEIEAAIKVAGKHAYTVGKKFGTVGFTVEGQMIEVTTFRAEKYEANNRKPSVEYVQDICQDLSRRDFTINAIALKEDKTVIDPYMGIQDIFGKRIMCVGNPTLRFKDDPLRMLRAIRFACQLNFNIDEATYKSIKKNNYRILHISKERWCMELDKILISPDPARGIRLLADCGLFSFIIPELQLQLNYDQKSKYHAHTLLEHTVRVVQKCPCNLNLRWAALLHDIGKPFVRTEKGENAHYIFHERVGAEIVEKLADYLKWSNDRRKEVKELVKNHMTEDSPLRPYDFEAHYALTEQPKCDILIVGDK